MLTGFWVYPDPFMAVWNCFCVEALLFIVRNQGKLINQMKKIIYAAGSLLLLVMFSSAVLPPGRIHKLYTAGYENVLGTSMELKIDAVSEQQAMKAEAAVLAEIDRLNKILSGYDASSEFSRWMKQGGKAMVVSPELYEVLSLFEQWRRKTGGALDAAAETVNNVWREAARQNRLPSATEISAAVNAVKQQHYILNEENHTALRNSEAPL
ncbi:MAG: apbE 1, partial [Sediminibacterium sp.]|nr:apbE 1 [Sediminibacterium sp.]